MVTALLNPKEAKSFFDLLTLGIMGVEIALFFVLPVWAKQLLFVFVFAFWRLAYNAGLGVLLKYQSDGRGLVRLAKKYEIFDAEKNPKVYRWVKRQLSMKMGDDYDFDVSKPIANRRVFPMLNRYAAVDAHRIQHVDAVSPTRRFDPDERFHVLHVLCLVLVQHLASILLLPR